MTVEQKTGDTERLIAVREVQFMQGVHVARIDIIYSDEPDLNKLKLKCEKVWVL